MNPHPFFLYPFFITLFLTNFVEHTLHIFPSPRIDVAFVTSTPFLFPLPRARERGIYMFCRTLLFKKGLTFLWQKGPIYERNLGFYNSNNGESY